MSIIMETLREYNEPSSISIGEQITASVNNEVFWNYYILWFIEKLQNLEIIFLLSQVNYSNLTKIYEWSQHIGELYQPVKFRK